MKLSHNSRILAALLLVLMVGGILLTPLGFETRAAAVLSNPSSIPWLGFAFGGLILIIASPVLLFFRPRIAAVLAIIGSVSLAVLSTADQAGLFVSLRPPLLVTVLEIATAAVIPAIIFFAYRVYKEPRLGPE